MTYVDLNPIRAKMADTAEESDYTSIQQRIHTLLNDQNNDSSTQPIELYPFAGNVKDDMPDGIPFRLVSIITKNDSSCPAFIQITKFCSIFKKHPNR